MGKIIRVKKGNGYIWVEMPPGGGEDGENEYRDKPMRILLSDWGIVRVLIQQVEDLEERINDFIDVMHPFVPALKRKRTEEIEAGPRHLIDLLGHVTQQHGTPRDFANCA